VFNYKTFSRGISVFILAMLFILPNFAQQNLTQPRVSQQASVSQRVGLTDITINLVSCFLTKEYHLLRFDKAASF